MLRNVIALVLLPVPFAVLLFPLAWLRAALRPDEPWYLTWPFALWAILTFPTLFILTILLFVLP